ncbi:MAG: hypothetical protein AB9M53_03080 [Leptothrix sp. (in: b-proteobacteria)]
MKCDRRSVRRHHISRLKQRWRARQCGKTAAHEPQDLPRRIGLRVNTAAPCSCALCGNPRRYFSELTVQERRASLADRIDADDDPPQEP